MSLQHGRGKESFRAFNRVLKDEVSYILKAAKDEQYTANDVVRFLTQVVNEYVQTLRAQELDVEFWSDRAIDKQVKAQDDIITRLQLIEQIEHDEDENPSGENEDFNPDDTEGDGTLFGFPIVNQFNKSIVRATSKPRHRIFLTLDELGQYVPKVPYVTFIQLIHRPNGEVNYRVWVEASKDKKRRRNV